MNFYTRYKLPNTRYKTRSASKGFTLTELLVVLGITAVLSTVSFSLYINQQRTKLLEATAQEIVGFLKYAQQKSMFQEEGKQWNVHFENPASGSDFYALYTGDTYLSPIETRYLPQGITFGAPEEGSSINIPFYKLLGDSLGGTIIVKGYFNQYVVIRVSSRGLILYGNGSMVSGYAWNDRIGWVNFDYPGGNIFLPEGEGELSGFAWSDNAGWISLNCVSTNSCASVDYKVLKDANGELSGWAWSEKFGWISFNCSNDNSCLSSNYKVMINSSTREFEGYAWSQNLGWFSFNCKTGGAGGTDICLTSDYKVILK